MLRETDFRIDTWREFAKYTFGFSVLVDSVAKRYLEWSGIPPLISSDGQWLGWDRRQQAGGDFSRDRAAVLGELNGDNYDHFEFNEEGIELLRRMRETLERRGQSYRVFISPIEPCVLDLLRTPRRAVALSRIRAAVRNVFPEVLDYSASAYSVPENFYGFDPYHLRTTVAARFIRDVLDGRPPQPMPAGLICQR